MTRGMTLFCAVLLAGGCDWFEDPSPEQARLLIQGEAGKSIRLIVSTKFASSVNEIGQTRVVIFESDTLMTTLPYEQVYRIDEDQRFFAEASRLDADLENVHMQVYVDEARHFDQAGRLLEGRPYRFVFSFNQAITRDILVL
jgi:hypothetical protein